MVDKIDSPQLAGSALQGVHDVAGMIGLQLRSLVKKSGELELSLARVPVPEPAADEVVVRVEASPLNPSDLGLLLGPADMSTAKAGGTKDNPTVTAKIPEQM